MAISREYIDELDFADVTDGSDLIPPVTPGEILREDFIEPLGLSANGLARALHVPPNPITSILKGAPAIPADAALRVARYSNTTPACWLHLQKNYECEVAKRQVGRLIKEEAEPRAAKRSVAARSPFARHGVWRLCSLEEC